MAGTLFVVGTPIGNLGDMSPRAVQAMAQCDFIAAEDTRVTLKLLNHFDIKKPMVSYYEHNRAQKGSLILDRIISGENCVLVTDAGMPAISDPGIDLVDLCHEAGVSVVSVPGPSAIVTAAAISGLDVSRFSFEGFLSVNKPKRREHLAELVTERKTMIFYEAPHKLAATLNDLYETLGDRRIAIIKELTKIHESVERTTLKEAAGKYDGIKLKGEYVIIIEAKKDEEDGEEIDGIALAKKFVSSGMKMNDAAKLAAQESGMKKGDIYKALTEDKL
ncbi:MAG: 16S rRNA (cytidine(1402)-2'-O)-methyltransferase [Oscillospiraceae bacterium]|nr:16S rRNA (cytidine(1402)-2'-O)-methyltransferase [Oscillospiraceae bacterium]MDD7353560.1 16S rRNA (cytidine(1402)-2'-O)-methyltransferase [Oscillospiraceae bacterium]MDY3937194.1 16S rRNA (cytidine(1402)-2'-O)-methyltransferase [Oscillospiraceae bacterium]